MSYLICNECEIYYEIDSDFNTSGLDTCEKCGRGLKYYSKLDEYYKEKDLIKNADYDDLYIESENYTYEKIATTGLILAIIGLFVLILSYVLPFFFILQTIENPDNIFNSFVYTIVTYSLSFIFMVAGVLIYIYGKRNGNNLEMNVKRENEQNNIKRHVQKEKSTVDYFKKLPEGYFILNNLKISRRKIKIDSVVIGPTGIFLTMIKNSRSHYIINNNEWLNNKGKMTAKSLGNPSRQIKSNAIELKRFLSSKNLDIDYRLINSIVAFSNRNFTVRKMPRTYKVMHIEEISNFIINSKTKMDMGTVTGSVLLLEPYSSGIMRT